MPKTTPEQNKALVLETFRHTLQQARLWVPRTILVAELHPAQRALVAINSNIVGNPEVEN